jgi:hypothetical protein
MLIIALPEIILYTPRSGVSQGPGLIANATALLVKGAEIDRMLETSPLMLIVYASTIIPLIAIIVYYRSKPGGRAKARIAAATLVALIALLVVIDLAAVHPGEYYGAWISDRTVNVKYYTDNVFSADLCKANITLVTLDKALDMLEIRTNGISDPTSNIHMGHFRLYDGSKGDVIIIGRNVEHVIVISSDGEKALVGLPGAEVFYKNLLEARLARCGRAG